MKISMENLYVNIEVQRVKSFGGCSPLLMFYTLPGEDHCNGLNKSY